MKTLKFFSVLLFAGMITMAINACGGCDNEDPRARIINNGTDKASVQIKTSGGNTVNINNVDPGTSSAYDSYAPGQVTFTITVKSQDYVQTVTLSTCYDYDIAIDANNVITTKSVKRD